MSPERYFDLLFKLEQFIAKKDTNMRKSISADERLTLTLRYLASGESQQDLSFHFRISRTSVSCIVYEVSLAIWNHLKDEFLPFPNTEPEWRNIAKEFEDDWNLPHCIGAIDGKHIAMDCPRGSGTNYHNYKGYFSTVLLAICDANYCFTFIDVGNYGHNNDAGILSSSAIGKRFREKKANLPPPERLEGCPLEKAPYFLVGDDIFGLSDWLMKPYPGRGRNESERVFNYRLSRARRVIENSFGILRARWRIFARPIRACVLTVEAIVLAACILHNYLRLTDNPFYCPAGFVDCETSAGDIRPGDWRSMVHEREAMRDLPKPKGHRLKESALQIRDAMKVYVNSPIGSVGWQLKHVNSLGPTNN